MHELTLPSEKLPSADDTKNFVKTLESLDDSAKLLVKTYASALFDKQQFDAVKRAAG